MNSPAASSLPTVDFSSLSQEVVRQPDLFGALAAIQSEQQVVEAARARRYDGSRVPEAKAATIVALRLAGTSLRGIERQTGADKRTVAAVIQLAEQQGIVPPIKEALSRRMAELSDRTMTMVEDEMERDEPDAQLIKAGWVGIGIAADKSAAAGAAGAGQETQHRHLHLHVAGPEDPAAVYARMLSGAVVDVESAVSTTNPTPIGTSAGPVAVLATTPTPANPAPEPLEAPDLVPDPSAQPQRGAGGVASIGGGPRMDGTP